MLDISIEYTPDHIATILEVLGIDRVSDTGSNFLCLCPYHDNTDTPAFAIDYTTGVWWCFSCEARGILPKLIRDQRHCSVFEAGRLITQTGKAIEVPLTERLKKLKEPVELVRYDGDIDGEHQALRNCAEAQEYLYGRGFTRSTLKYFNIGYSKYHNMVTVPFYAPDGMPLGVVRRSITGKEFKNSWKLPKKDTLWNFNNARKYEHGIITEASFDAMRIYQAGFPGVVATLGGAISPAHREQIERSFTSLTIFMDGDEEGTKFAKKIEEQLSSVKIYWSWHGESRFPEGAHDAGDMTDEDIKQCMDNRLTSFEYRLRS